METKRQTSGQSYEYTTFPREFVTYKWFKPLLVALLTAVLSFLVQAVVGVLGTIWLGNPELLREAVDKASPYFYSGPGAFMAVGGVAAMLPSLALAERIVRGRPFSSYSSSRGGWNWNAFAKCFALAVVVFGLSIVISNVVFPDPASDGINKFTIIGVLICVVLVPFQAAAEEYVYRGLLMQAIGSWTKLPVVAMVLSSLIFAASHTYNVFGIVSVFLHGLGYAFLAWRSRGLEASSSAHIANNLTVILCTGLGFGSAQEGGLETVVLTVGIMAVYCVAVVLLDKKFGWFTPQGDGVTAFNEAHGTKAA